MQCERTADGNSIWRNGGNDYVDVMMKAGINLKAAKWRRDYLLEVVVMEMILLVIKWPIWLFSCSERGKAVLLFSGDGRKAGYVLSGAFQLCGRRVMVEGRWWAHLVVQVRMPAYSPTCILPLMSGPFRQWCATCPLREVQLYSDLMVKNVLWPVKAECVWNGEEMAVEYNVEGAWCVCPVPFSVCGRVWGEGECWPQLPAQPIVAV